MAYITTDGIVLRSGSPIVDINGGATYYWPRYALTDHGVVMLRQFPAAAPARRALKQNGLTFIRWMKFLEAWGTDIAITINYT